MPTEKFPESRLVRNTFVIRDMDLPPDVKQTKKALLRWFCLATGLLSENETRTTVLDILDSLFYFQFSKNINPTTLQIQSYIKEKKGGKIIEKLIQYHLNRFIALNLVERKRKAYSFKNSPYHEKRDLKEAFNYLISTPLQRNLKDIGETYQKLADSYL